MMIFMKNVLNFSKNLINLMKISKNLRNKFWKSSVFLKKTCKNRPQIPNTRDLKGGVRPFFPP